MVTFVQHDNKKILCFLILITFVIPMVNAQNYNGIALLQSQRSEGALTANGEYYSYNRLTAASRELPFNSILKLTNLHNGATTIVRINDRHQSNDNYMLLLSDSAAQQLYLDATSTAPIHIEIISQQSSSQIPLYPVVNNADTSANGNLIASSPTYTSTSYLMAGNTTPNTANGAYTNGAYTSASTVSNAVSPNGYLAPGSYIQPTSSYVENTGSYIAPLSVQQPLYPVTNQPIAYIQPLTP